MKLNLKEVLKPAGILFAICLIVAAALAGTNLLTEEKIAEAAAKKAEESRLVVLPGADSFEAKSDGSSGEYYVGQKGGSTVGYVFETSAKGYGGDVKVMTGFSVSGDITGVVILSHSETPGLGANAEKEEFRNQFKQEKPIRDIEVVKYQTPEHGQIEAMTGATITSKAVTTAVNQAQSIFYAVTELE